MTDTELIVQLFNLGWTIYGSVAEAIQHPEALDQLLQMYAGFHGLSSEKDVETHITEIRFCSLPDTMPFGASVCKWGDPHITWDLVGPIAGLTPAQIVSGITTALDRWAKVCGIIPQYTPGNPGAKIKIQSRQIDGPMGVLAESELPCGNVQQCRQWYDSSEAWSLFDGPGTNPQLIDFIRVATHELGHALGMNHIGAGNLLAPVYSPSIWTPQQGDIIEMQARYGPPVVTPPVPTGNSGEEIIIRVKGGSISIDGKRITDMISTI